MMTIDNTYRLGDTVYLCTDMDQFPRLVTGIRVIPNGILYELSCGEGVSSHYDFEIAASKDMTF